MDDSPPRLPDVLETPRLRMRRFEAADLPFLYELHSDPEVTRYLGGNGEPRPPEKSREWLDSTLRWYEEKQVGQYLVSLREGGQPIGRSGFSTFEVERSPSSADGIRIATWGAGSAAPGAGVSSVLEVGYSLLRAHWGQGLGSEAAQRWYDHALGEYGAQEAHSVIHAENKGSLGIARKLGLTRLEHPVRMDGEIYLLFRKARA